MIDNNNKFVPQAQTYEVKYVENQEQQKPKLSPAARAKVVNNGSYVSSKTTDLVPSYGPCSAPGCPYSTSFRVNIEVPSRNSFSGSHRFIFESNGSEYISFTCNTVEQAENRLAEFENGTWRVAFEGALWTSEGGGATRVRNTQVKDWLHSAISDHKNGNSVNLSRQLTR